MGIPPRLQQGALARPGYPRARVARSSRLARRDGMPASADAVSNKLAPI